MKTSKILAMLLTLAMIFCLCACGAEKSAPAPAATEEPAAAEPAAEETAKAPEAVEVRGITVPAFSITVNGVKVDNEMLAAYPVYSVEASSVNSSGTASTVTFVGFAMKDVLEAAGLTENYVWLEATADDAYAVTFTGDILASTTLLAVSRDGSQFKTAPWFAPCSSATTGDYLKSCVSILVNTVEGAPEIKAPAEEKAEPAAEEAPAELELTGDAPDKQDKTEKVTFGDFSFKINGEEVNNAKLEGLSIYKVTVVTENSKGVRAESVYTGYVLADVLKACGIENAASVKAVASDGYESELTAEQIAGEYTIVAIEKDKETGENGTIWVAPCTETSSKAYCKGVVELITG